MRPIIGISANVSPPNDPKRTFSVGTKIHYIQEHYCQFVLVGGGVPVLLPVIEELELVVDLTSNLDGLIITGGIDVEPSLYYEINTHSMGCDILRDKFEIELVNVARKLNKPVLGICRGIQVLNVAYGGTLYQDIPTMIEGALTHHRFSEGKETFHTINLTIPSALSEVFKCDSLEVNSSHHQSVKTLGEGLVTLATAPDGVIEAVYSPNENSIYGVQWHPERMLNEPKQVDLARWFIQQANKRI